MSWRDRAPCRGLTDLFFPQIGQSTGEAEVLCAACPFREQCLAETLAWEYEHGPDSVQGFCGGMGWKDRMMLHRRRPRASRWATTLATFGRQDAA